MGDLMQDIEMMSQTACRTVPIAGPQRGFPVELKSIFASLSKPLFFGKADL